MYCCPDLYRDRNSKTGPRSGRDRLGAFFVLEHVDDDDGTSGATELKDGLDGALSGVARFFVVRFSAAVSIALCFRS